MYVFVCAHLYSLNIIIVLLYRVGYVICDPVLACLTITPILVLNHLPADLEQRDCFHFHQLYNDTVECLKNATKFSHYQGYVKPSPSDWVSVISSFLYSYLVLGVA